MTPRENLLACLNHKTPQWVPRSGSFTPYQIRQFKERTGESDIAAYFGMDNLGGIGLGPTRRRVDFSSYHKYYVLPDHISEYRIDEWGVGWVPGSLLHFEDMIHPMHSLDSLAEFEAYPYPDLDAAYRRDGVRERVRELHDLQLPVIAYPLQLGGTIFESAWYMRGLENLLTDMLCNTQIAAYHLDRLTQMAISNAAFLAECGSDVFISGDDIATQRGMMISPEMWREWLKPRLASIYEAARSKKPDIQIWYHSDGDCREVIPDLIEIGVTILNPVQPECMDPAWVKREYGRDLALWGTIGTQTTMPFGTPSDVRETVKRMIDQCGIDGGLFIAPTHVIEPDVPWENIVALYDACREFGGDPKR